MPATKAPSKSNVKPWKCDVCNKPIRAGEAGSLEIYDPTASEPNVYPRRRSETYEEAEARLASPDSTPSKGFQIRSAREILAITPTQRIAFRVQHARCDPRPGSIAYAIDINDIASAEKWMSTVEHLMGKRWFGFDDAKRALSLWWENRSLDRDRSAELC